MCILLKLDYAKFGVSNFFFQKLSKETLWETLPPLVQGTGSVKFCNCSIVKRTTAENNLNTVIMEIVKMQ